MGGDWAEHHTDLQSRRVPHDDRSIVDLFLDGGDVYVSGSRANTVRNFPGIGL